MKKTFLFLVALFLSLNVFAQKEKELVLNEETNLIEATYFHSDGEISQKGTFNLDKKLHGEWISYNKKGEIISVGSYIDGLRTGKWLFWSNDILKEVQYNDNAIAGVSSTENTEGIVSRN